MARKASCDSTEYTNGFRITHTPDGFFVAVKGNITLKARCAKEINELIKEVKEEEETEKS